MPARILPAAVLCLLLAGPATLMAQDTAQTPPPPPCSAPEHRQFDFWLGAWNVTMPDGTRAGENRIESILGGCVLRESWTGARGLQGHSFNAYDRALDAWHQTWVDGSGTVLKLDGGLVDGSMVLQGKRPAPSGEGEALHRISWTPQDSGTVRQHWEVSSDDGATWKTLFDGTYARKQAD